MRMDLYLNPGFFPHIHTHVYIYNFVGIFGLTVENDAEFFNSKTHTVKYRIHAEGETACLSVSKTPLPTANIVLFYIVQQRKINSSHLMQCAQTFCFHTYHTSV